LTEETETVPGVAEVGVESDPRAYRFDGELNIANRGVMEFIEMLKADERFLYVLLTLSQEQNIKTGRFSMIYADEVVVSHTNETEYKGFVGNKKSEALQDRIILVKVPYNLRVSDEVVSRAHREAWWRRMSRRMDRASLAFSEQVRDTVLLRRDLDDDFYDDLLEILVGADAGMGVAQQLVASLRERVRLERIDTAEEALSALKAEMLGMLMVRDRALHLDGRPSVVVVVGVNGSGKTTTLGKFAHRLRGEGMTPLVAAADTFRAAAIDQMRLWANRSGTEVVAHRPGADPGAVVYDAIQAARARGADVVLVDTAGRLHTKSNLMAELEKVRRVIERSVPGAPHETLLVIEAPTGMNAVAQARAFHEAVTLTGIVLTKLDGTSRGGTILAIEAELDVPVKLVGMGEGIDDLNVFDPAAYLDALFAGVLEVPAG